MRALTPAQVVALPMGDDLIALVCTRVLGLVAVSPGLWRHPDTGAAYWTGDRLNRPRCPHAELDLRSWQGAGLVAESLRRAGLWVNLDGSAGCWKAKTSLSHGPVEAATVGECLCKVAVLSILNAPDEPKKPRKGR